MPSIWVMNADGSKQRRVSRVFGEYPAWSPDGRKIAFDRNTFGPTGWDIWVVNADGSHPRPLIASRADEQGAAWSPDGKTIAYGSGQGAPPTTRASGSQTPTALGSTCSQDGLVNAPLGRSGAPSCSLRPVRSS